LTETHFLHLPKSFTEQSLRASKKDSFYMEVKMFFDDLDIMKLYSFEVGFHFREYENISWCIVRWIRWVAGNHHVMVLQEVLKCNGRMRRGTVAQNEPTAVLRKLQPLLTYASLHFRHLYVEFTVNCFSFRPKYL